MPAWIIAAVAAAYLGLLFAIAYRGDKAAAVGHSLIANPYVYSLSLAVYATAWTFYGSVGRAADSGIGFLPIYLGPTVMAALWWVVLRKIIRIAKDNRITSLADFISSRYGKSAALAGLVTVIAVVGVIPYVSLQLKAISTSFNVLRGYPDILPLAQKAPEAVLGDTAFYVALILAAFTIVFGTRHLDAAERVWRVSGSLPDLYALLARFLGAGNAKVAFTAYARPRGRDWPQEIDAELARYCEAQLAGVIGAASARVMLATGRGRAVARQPDRLAQPGAAAESAGRCTGSDQARSRPRLCPPVPQPGSLPGHHRQPRRCRR